MQENNMKIEIDSKIDNVAVIRVAVTSFISILPISVDELMDIKTSVSEAVTNCIEHGYENSSGKIIVTVTLKEDATDIINISVTDFGKGIENIELAMTPAYTSKPELEHAGLGFTIMETFMDHIIVDSTLNSGTTVTMMKKLKIKKSNNVKLVNID